MDTPFNIRKLVIDHHLNRLTQRQISAALNLPRSTVNDIIQSFKNTGNIESQRHGRAPTNRVVSSRDDRRLRLASIRNPQASGGSWWLPSWC